jgi:hypothetical protein
MADRQTARLLLHRWERDEARRGWTCVAPEWPSEGSADRCRGCGERIGDYELMVSDLPTDAGLTASLNILAWEKAEHPGLGEGRTGRVCAEGETMSVAIGRVLIRVGSMAERADARPVMVPVGWTVVAVVPRVVQGDVLLLLEGRGLPAWSVGMEPRMYGSFDELASRWGGDAIEAALKGPMATVEIRETPPKAAAPKRPRTKKKAAG